MGSAKAALLVSRARPDMQMEQWRSGASRVASSHAPRADLSGRNRLLRKHYVVRYCLFFAFCAAQRFRCASAILFRASAPSFRLFRGFGVAAAFVVDLAEATVERA